MCVRVCVWGVSEREIQRDPLQSRAESATRQTKSELSLLKFHKLFTLKYQKQITITFIATTIVNQTNKQTNEWAISKPGFFFCFTIVLVILHLLVSPPHPHPPLFAACVYAMTSMATTTTAAAAPVASATLETTATTSTTTTTTKKQHHHHQHHHHHHHHHQQSVNLDETQVFDLRKLGNSFGVFDLIQKLIKEPVSLYTIV